MYQTRYPMIGAEIIHWLVPDGSPYVLAEELDSV